MKDFNIISDSSYLTTLTDSYSFKKIYKCSSWFFHYICSFFFPLITHMWIVIENLEYGHYAKLNSFKLHARCTHYFVNVFFRETMFHSSKTWDFESVEKSTFSSLSDSECHSINKDKRLSLCNLTINVFFKDEKSSDYEKRNNSKASIQVLMR